MFQPQSTAYSPFSTYTSNSAPFHDFLGFQSSAGLVDTGGPTVFRDPIFSPVTTNSYPALDLPHNNTRQHQYKMESGDLEVQEALARDFQPTLHGPLISEKKSSDAIAEEYAKADPIYIAKATALPQKYSHYRPVLGDGNCGWRAVGFSYFETLVRLQQRSQLESEVVRMVSLNNLLMKVGGFEAWLLEDMVEETTNLLNDLSTLVETAPRDAESLLLDRFNNKEVSDSIVYHLRLLASSWLQKEPDKYQGFIADENGVEGYRKGTLEPVNTEIEHLGMTLLIDVLLKPVGIHVEIVYLDRSEGSQVNVHLIQPEDEHGKSTNPGGPIMHLLYRPGHYDILYKHQLPLLPTDVQVVRANIAPQVAYGAPTDDFSDISDLSFIPGFSLGPRHAFRPNSYPSQYQAPADESYSSSISNSISPIPPRSTSLSTASTQGLPLTFPIRAQSQPMISSSHPSPQPPFSQQTQLPIHASLSSSRPSSLSLPSETVPSPSSTTSFRPSKYEWAAAADWHEGPIACQTSTFKNSHFNIAHYNNPKFQPEEWTPESDEPPASRKKSTSSGS